MNEAKNIRLRVLAIGVEETLRNHLAEVNEMIDLVEGTTLEIDPTADDHVGVILMHERVGTKGAAMLVRRFHGEHRSIPIVWLQDNERPLTPFGAALPDLVWTGAIEPGRLVERLSNLLSPQLYPDEVVEATTDATMERLADSFHSPCTIEALHLEADGEPCEINAFVPFCGKSLSGRLSVGGTIDSLLAIHRRIVSTKIVDPTQDSEDLAGEIANQVLGHFKRVIAQQSLTFEAGTPVVWLKGGTRIRFPGCQSKLVLTTRCDQNMPPLLVGMALDRLALEEMKPTAGHAVETGELVFF